MEVTASSERLEAALIDHRRKRKEGHQDTLLRSSIVRMRTSTVSAMPEGHEREISPEQMTDLLEFLQGLGSASAHKGGR